MRRDPRPRAGPAGAGTRGRCLLALLAVVVGLVVAVEPAAPTDATSIVPFAARYSDNDNGSIAVFGNNLMVCPAAVSDSAAARASTVKKNNNSYNMVHLDVDGAAFPTFSSSSADVVIPPDAEVTWAGLYWGARLGAGAGGVNAVGDGSEMKLRAPGDAGYRTIRRSVAFGPTRTADRAYQSFADVTSVVQQAGPGSYTGADVPAATGEDRYSGWSLVVVYRAPSLPLRNLTVFDGLADVGQNDPQAITISGFRTPVSGAVNARIGLVAYEGDVGSSGDRAIFNGTLLATSLSPGTNFFNGTNDDNGTLVTARTPADANMLGFDIKNFDAPGILGNNASSATIDLASTSERYFPGVVTTAIDVFAPDFSPSTKTVTNLSGGDPARVGDRLRYTVTFVNAGQDPAINTSIADPLPAGTTYVPGSLVIAPADGTGSFDAATNTVRVSPGSFPIGRSMTFTFDVDVGAAAADTAVANRATITYDGATVTELRGLTFSTPAAAIAVVPTADLSVTKVNAPPTSVVAGGTLTSTLTVRNDGPSPATDVVVTDELPAGLGTVTASAPCTVAAQLVTCAFPTLAAGATQTITVQSAVPPGSVAGTLTDVARVTSATADPDPDDNTAGATTAVARNADLAVTKTASPTTVTPGGAVTYTITVTNDGPSTATPVTIDDTVDGTDVALVSADVGPSGICSTAANTARCTLPTLAPGATVEMIVQAVALPSATPGDTVTNNAAAASATPDADPADNSAPAAVTIGPAASALTVTKAADAPTPLIAGLGQVRYTIDVANDGPSDADPVTLTDTLPAGFAVVSATSDRGTCAVVADPGGDTVTCGVGRLLAPFGGAPAAQARITVVADVPAGVATGEYANVATATAPSAPPATSPSAPVTVEARANLSIIKSFPADTTDVEITPGEPKTYRIRVINDGPSVAADVTVADELPDGLTATEWRVVSVTPPGPDPFCSPVTASCALGDVPPGTTVELELDVLVDDDLVIDPAVGVANTATVTSATDLNVADNTSTFTASGGAQADLSIRKTAPAGTPIAGDTSPATLADRTFRLEIANFGPSAAPGLTFSDTLPPGMTFRRFYDFDNPDLDLTPFLNCTVTGTPVEGQTVSCAPTFVLPAFVGVFFGVEFSVDPTVPNGTVLENTATAASDADDDNQGNNTSGALVSVRTEVNLRVEKQVVEMDANGNFLTIPPEPFPRADDPLGVPPGHAVSFAVIVTNDGPSAAANVQFTDAFPLDATYFPVGDCDFLNGETICRYTNPTTGDLLAPGDAFGNQIITVLKGDTPEGLYTNTASATTSTTETTLTDNVDTRDIEVVAPVADLVIEKQAATSPLVAGGTFTYQIAVAAGVLDFEQQVLRLSSDAEDVVVADTLPTGLVPASASSSQGTCAISGQDVRCELGTVAATSDFSRPTPPALVTVTGTVASAATGADVTNTAVATTATALRGGGDSVEASTTTPLTRSADLTVTKSADSPTAAAGGGITFTVTVTNTGPSDATDVVLTDLLPAPLEFSDAASADDCAVIGGDVVCALGTLTAGSSRALTIGATLPSDADADTVTNTAAVTSAVPDPDPDDDSAAVDVSVVQAADLSVTKTAAAEGVLLGGTIAYTVTVANAGPSDATGVVLTESIPEGTTVASAPGCTGTDELTCTVGDLAAGDARTFVVELDVPDTLAPGALDNTASITSDTDDPDPTDDSASATVEAIAQADVTLTKELVTTDPVAGQPVQYRLMVVNNGPTVAPNASLSDPVPTGTSFVSVETDHAGGTCRLDEAEVAATPSVSCDLGRLGVGETATATMTVATDPDATTLTNTGFAGSGGLDENPDDNEATATDALGVVADLAVTKTGSATVADGTPAVYEIAYANAGPSTATDVVVTDTLGPGLIPRPAAGCTIAATVVTCAVGRVAPGATGSISITADLDPSVAFGTVITDVAAVSSSAVDPVPANDSAGASTTAQGTSDVAVAVSADEDEVMPGDVAGFTVTVTNNGPQVAPDVVVANGVPPDLVSLVPTGPGDGMAIAALTLPAQCTGAGIAVTCALGDLAVGQDVVLHFSGAVPARTAARTVLLHEATVSTTGSDVVAENNVRRASILVVVRVTATTTTVRPGGGGGQLPATGLAVAGALVLAAGFVIAGGGLRTAAADRARRARRR